MDSLKQLLGIVIIALFIVSCSNNNTSKKSAESIDDITIDDFSEAVDDMPMPSSFEIIQLLNESGAGYIFDITNSPENVEGYISYKQKAINLGIYAADLIYTTTYQKRNETAMYLDNFVQLVGDLEITTLDANFFESVQNNLDNKDSLIIIVKKAEYDTHKFLNETGNDELALYALTGSWVEGMYLVSATLKYAENKKPLLEMIIKHKKSLEVLIKLMAKYKDDENFSNLYNSLDEIFKLFSKLEKNKTDMKTAEELKEKLIEFRNSLV